MCGGVCVVGDPHIRTPKMRRDGFPLLAVAGVACCLLGASLPIAASQQEVHAVREALGLEIRGRQPRDTAALSDFYRPDYNNDEEDSDDEAYYAYYAESTVGGAGRHTMQRYYLPLDLYPDAVCNDGSPAGYYYGKGGSDDSGFIIEDNTWLVFLEGGGWCWDEESCEQRKGIYPHLMSSSKWGESKALTGIFSTDPTVSPLAAASKVFVPYCSSDGWVGDEVADSSNGNRHFRGAAIVKAVFADLQRLHGLGLGGPAGAGTDLFFSGCSAGARGALFNLDYIPGLVPHGVRVRGVFDSALWIDIQPFAQSKLTSLALQTEKLLEFMPNARNRLGQACVQAYPDEEWKCLLGEYRAPLLQHPFFLSESQYDSFQLYWALGGRSPPYHGDAALYAEEFRKGVRAAIERVFHAPGSNGLYSTACSKHCVVLSKDFWSTTVDTQHAGSVSMSESLREWMERDSREKILDVEHCHGFNCGCAKAKGWNDLQ